MGKKPTTPLEASVASKDNKIKDKVIKELVCGKCDYKWWPRSQKPVTCPRCKCRNWENYK
jgi:predicted Zn-ribbon and HTH transcriptional regulator